MASNPTLKANEIIAEIGDWAEMCTQTRAPEECGRYLERIHQLAKTLSESDKEVARKVINENNISHLVLLA